MRCPPKQAAHRQSEDAAASGQLLAERDAQIGRLRAQLAGDKDDRDLEIEALTEERDRLDAALAVRAGFDCQISRGFTVDNKAIWVLEEVAPSDARCATCLRQFLRRIFRHNSHLKAEIEHLFRRDVVFPLCWACPDVKRLLVIGSCRVRSCACCDAKYHD